VRFSALTADGSQQGETPREEGQMMRRREGGGTPAPAALSGELTAEEASLFTSLIQSPESAANGKRALADYIAIMREGPRNTASTPEELMELAGRMKKTKSYGG